MASAILPPLLQPQNPTMSGSASLSVLEANGLRLAVIVQRLQSLFSSSSRSSEELHKLCSSLARGIDYALSKNDIPNIALQLPSIVKEVYQHRNDDSLQSAITILMIAIKNACRNKWFCGGDRNELLKMANELLGNFCTDNGITIEASNALNTISKIISRFYPQLKLGGLLVSFEAKPGYDVLMSDFHIGRFTSCEETIGLFVAQTDNLETSSCIINPPQVSFLVNGKGVAGRTNVFQEKGPQLPTDITKMLKYGTNIIQTVGYFNGNYIIAVALMSKATHFPVPKLKEYVQSAIATLAPGDSEIVEGPSRISLNCPISLKRIGTPVKGYLCRHLQCFDYYNFLEMNSRKPSWRCPFCNQPISYIDLRTDQNLMNILRDVPLSATEVVISSDGSWKVVFDNDKSDIHQDQDTGVEPTGIQDAQEKVVDLTVDEDKAYEIDDVKPLKDLEPIPVSDPSSHQTLNYQANIQNFGTLESLVPTSVLNPVITDAISPPPNLSINQQVSTLRNTQSIPRQVSRVPPAVQALAARSQAFHSYQSTRSDSINPNFNIPTNSPSISRQTIPVNTNSPSISYRPFHVNTTASISSERLHPYLMNSSSHIVRGPPIVSHQTVSSMTLISDGDIDMLRVSSDLVSSQNQDQVFGSRSSASLGLREMDACNAQQQTLLDHRISLNQSINAPTVGSSLPVMANSSPFVGDENLQNNISDQNWQPTRRMRGSLTGSAYTNAINSYLVHPSQLVLNSNSNNMNGSSVQQANWRPSGFGNYR